MKKLLKFLGPLLFIGVYLAVLFYFRGRIPETAALLAKVTGLYDRFGYGLVFSGAFLEVLFLVGFYVPGSAVVLLGAALSKSGIIQFPYVYLLGTLGALLGYCINYAFGRFGLGQVLILFGLESSMKAATEKVEKHGVKALLVGYVIPGSASFLSTAAGALRMPLKTFLIGSVISQLFWSFLWATLAYFFGLRMVSFIIKYFVFILIIGFVVWVVQKRFFTKKK